VSGFDLFVGIDWSGARGPVQRGLAVFICAAGDAAPSAVYPQNGRHWSRRGIMAYLCALAQDRRVLAGIDFAFSYPVFDAGGQRCGYFPGWPGSPPNALALWQLIDRLNAGQPHLYGGAVWDDPVLGAYYNAPRGRRGRLFTSRRRLTEQAARAVKSPSPTFNCVGPAGVGTGSLAGMRLLAQMAGTADIWPFSVQDSKCRNLCLVEIFPSYYFALAGVRAVKGAHGTTAHLTQGLSYFGSAPMPPEFRPAGPDLDEADALISAAALRWLAAQNNSWSVPAPARCEGWIFGVKSDKS